MTHSLLAQITNPVLPGSLGSGGSSAGPPAIGSLISSFIGAFLIFSFVVAFMYLMLGGFNWITSGGDKAKLQAARDEITNAIVGLVIVGAAWALMTVVGNFIGINFPNLPIPVVGQ
jgi:hypothetical protein